MAFVGKFVSKDDLAKIGRWFKDVRGDVWMLLSLGRTESQWSWVFMSIKSGNIRYEDGSKPLSELGYVMLSRRDRARGHDFLDRPVEVPREQVGEVLEGDTISANGIDWIVERLSKRSAWLQPMISTK